MGDKNGGLSGRLEADTYVCAYVQVDAEGGCGTECDLVAFCM